MAVDPFLVAAKMTEDAVLAYHTTGIPPVKAYARSIWRLIYVSARKSQPLAFQSHSYRGVSVPSPLRTKGERMFGVEYQTRSGMELRVTSHERTLVDALDRPDLTGSWEEIWRSLEAVEFFDLDQVIAYTCLLGNATTAAKVGFFSSNVGKR